jgi:hypothetical protein
MTKAENKNSALGAQNSDRGGQAVTEYSDSSRIGDLAFNLSPQIQTPSHIL